MENRSLRSSVRYKEFSTSETGTELNSLTPSSTHSRPNERGERDEVVFLSRFFSSQCDGEFSLMGTPVWPLMCELLRGRVRAFSPWSPRSRHFPFLLQGGSTKDREDAPSPSPPTSSPKHPPLPQPCHPTNQARRCIHAPKALSYRNA